MNTFNTTKWVEFYSEHNPDEDKVKEIVDLCMTLEHGDARFNARRMMLQGYRLTQISDAQSKVVIERDPLRLLFLLIAAENVSKMHDDFEGEGKSRVYVRMFFDQFCSDDEKGAISAGIGEHLKPRDLQSSVDALYNVRCDVVHEGMYYDFHFMTNETPILNSTDPTIAVSITIDEFRLIVIKSIFRAVKQKVGF